MEIWRYLVLLSVIILLIIVGSKVIYRNDYVVIEGNVKLEAGTDGRVKQTVWNLSFPEGFNSNNCVCIAFGTRLYSETVAGYSYGTGFNDAIGLYLGDIPKTIELGSVNDLSKIYCQAQNIDSKERTLYYKIILMKI